MKKRLLSLTVAAMLAVSLFGAVAVSAAFPDDKDSWTYTNSTTSTSLRQFDGSALSSGLLVFESKYTVPPAGLGTGNRYVRMVRTGSSHGWCPLALYRDDNSFMAGKAAINHVGTSINTDLGGGVIALGDVIAGETYQVTAILQLGVACQGRILINGAQVYNGTVNVNASTSAIDGVHTSGQTSATLIRPVQTVLSEYVASEQYAAYLAQAESNDPDIEITGIKYNNMVYADFGIAVVKTGVVKVRELTEKYLTIPTGAQAYVFASAADADAWTEGRPSNAKASGASVLDGDILKVISRNGFTALTYHVSGKGLEFKPEGEMVTLRTAEYLAEDFNGFTAYDGTPPQGWVHTGGAGGITPLEGASGDEGDNAMGIICTNSNDRYTRTFDIPVSANEEFHVAFDAYYENTGWLMYLLENGDLTDENAAVGMNASGDSASPALRLGYAKAKTGTNITSFQNDGEYCTASPGEWHKYIVKVTPVNAETVRYTVTVDGGAEFTGLSQRDFQLNGVAGIGFAAISHGAETAQELRIDKIEVYSQKEIRRPEVEEIYYLKYDGTDQGIGGKISTVTSQIKLVFNTEVDEDNVERIVILKKGASTVECAYEFIREDGISILLIKLDRLLDTVSSYTLTVTAELSSSEETRVKASEPFEQSFETLNDPTLEIYKDSFEDNVYSIGIVKSNTAQKRYTLVVAAYENGVKDGIEYKKLVSFTYRPIVISSNQRGVFEYSTDALFDPTAGSIIKAYLTEYPSMRTLLQK